MSESVLLKKITPHVVVSILLLMTSGNLLVIYVILCNRKMRNDVNFFLVNLAIADLCVGIFCVMPNLYLYISQYWLIGRVRFSSVFIIITATYGYLLYEAVVPC